MKANKYTKIIAIIIFCVMQLKSVSQSSGFATVDCSNFYINGTPYRPLVVNYMIDFANETNSCSGNFYASPLWNYSAMSVGIPSNGFPAPCANPWGFSGRWGYERPGYPEVATAKAKLANDLLKIKTMGFNTIRVFAERPWYAATGFTYRGGSLTKTFEVIDDLLTAVQTHNSNNSDNMKVILNLGLGAQCGPTCGIDEWDDYSGFKAYIEAIANRYKNWPEVMAYDLYNEPDQAFYSPYHYNSSAPNDKYVIANWITEWYYAVKKYDPNHLVTIGLSGSDYTLGWDPNTIPVDFISLHLYSGTDALSTSENVIASHLYYAAKNLTKPWIIGETGYSGVMGGSSDPMIGTDVEQKTFATNTTKRSVDCGCKGYSWWQYQEASWGLYQQYFGLIKPYGSVTDNVEGTDKLIVQTGLTPPPPFTIYSGLTANAGLCVAPSNYYNFYGYAATLWTGTVRNELGVPIPNAYVLCMTGAGQEFKTYTDNTGFFRIYVTGSVTFGQLRISAPGYNTILFYSTPSGQNHTLIKVNYNNWTKRWTNSVNNVITNYIGSWGINDLDKFCNLDYDGDGKEDLLCLQNHGGNNDWATLLSYNNVTANWVQSWTNSGGDWIGAWHQQVAYNDRFITGDFDADGKDDLLSMQVFGSGDWCTLQKFSAGSWVQLVTNSGNDYIGPWKIETTDDFKVGDFNGDGKDDLLCIRKTSGNADLFSILNYNAGSWSYLTIAGNTMTNWGSDWMGSWKINPIDKFYIGDFDGDGKDDILAAQCTAGTGDWITLQTINTATGFFAPNLYTNSGNNTHPLYAYRNNLIVGDIDEDLSKELMGFTTTLAAKLDFSSGTFTATWNSGSNRFSDWYIASSTPFHSFVRTDKQSPEQLLAFKKIGAVYLGGMYLYNRMDCPTTRSMLANEDPTIAQEPAEEMDLVVYPDPTYGNATAMLNQASYENSVIYITSIQGAILKTIDLTGTSPGEQKIELNLENYPSGIYLISFVNSKKRITKRISNIK